VSEAFRVALTFDAEHSSRSLCPPGNTDAILDTLQHAGVCGTFFLEGRWASAYPATAARIVADGHIVGNHSHFHAELTLFSDHGLQTDVGKSERTIRDVTGTDPRPWFRCPYGLGHDDPRVVSTLDGLGYKAVLWHIDAEDWEPVRAASAIADDAVSGARAHGDGAVVLLHTWPQHTANALTSVVERLEDAGAQSVGIDQLDKIP
jgi:peptidoglycan/xylan/chitin deacetylase (PgdA/CDA1 family)